MAEADRDNFDAFLRWNSGHLLENRTRGAYAEWLVHRALGVDPGEHRIEWAEIDLRDRDLTLEVKSAAYVQAWPQKEASTISFPIEQRKATAYVFCLLAEQNRELVDPRDLNQWLFWVVPTTKLHADRKSIGLRALIRAHGEGIGYGELAARINHLRPSPSPEALAGGGDHSLAPDAPAGVDAVPAAVESAATQVTPTTDGAGSTAGGLSVQRPSPPVCRSETPSQRGYL